MLEVVLTALGILGTLGGIYLGHFLAERAGRRREERAEQRQARNVRTMLKIEIDQNLALLEEFWLKINQFDRPTLDTKIASLRRADRLRNLPWPHWSFRVWETQISLLPIALSEKEIKGAHDFYNRLEILNTIHSIVAPFEDQLRKLQISALESGTAEYEDVNEDLQNWYEQESLKIWKEFEGIYSQLHVDANPVRD